MLVEPSGFLLIDKREGPSSAQVVGLAKRLLRERGIISKQTKIGHGGTLDPMATGLLVVLVGRATRLADVALHGTKRYSGVIQLGITTDTDDRTGRTLEQHRVDPEKVVARLPEVVQRFTGTTSQRPPAYSALKINGQRAYDLARAGQEVQLAERQVELSEIVLTPEGTDQLRFSLRCSGGTYIRSFARDIGAVLGCGATLASLRREEVARLSVQDAVEQQALEALTPDAPFDGAQLHPWFDLLSDRPLLQVSQQEDEQLSRGDTRCFTRLSSVISDDSDVILYGFASQPRGVVRRVDDQLDLMLHVG